MKTRNDLILAIDASTTAAKAVIFDAEGTEVAQGRAPIALQNPAPDAYEQDAEEWWTAAMQAIQHAIGQLESGDAKRVRALGLTHQRETFVLTNQDGTPIHRALVWMDARSRSYVQRASAELGRDFLHGTTGKPPSTTPSFYKLGKLFEERPELQRARPRLLDVGAFLSFRLTGQLRTALGSADPLGLVDMRNRAWCSSLLEQLGLDASSVPELVESGACLGTVTAEVSRALGLPQGLPVIAVAGDGQAAGLGAGILESGSAYLNLGTAIVSGVISRDYRTSDAFRTLYGPLPGSFFLETDLKGGTFTLDWLVEKLLRDPRSDSSRGRVLDDLERDALALPPGSDGLMLVPYWNGVMNPYWDDHATGIVIGLHGAHGPEHFYRAILEGIALEQRLHSERVEAATARIERFVAVGGGARSRLWCQILADVLARPIHLALTREASALGAAIVASVGAHVHTDFTSAVSAMTGTREVFSKSGDSAHYAELYERVYAPLYPNLRAELGALAELRARAAVP